MLDIAIEEVKEIQKEVGVGNTPLLELKNITKLARKVFQNWTRS